MSIGSLEVLENARKREKMFNLQLYHIADQQSCVRFKLWFDFISSPHLVNALECEQVWPSCAIEARFRLLQECNPLVSKWLKQRLTLRRKVTRDRSMT